MDQDEEIGDWGENSFLELEKDLEKIGRQHEELQKFCQKPAKEIDRKWNSWSDKWTRQNDQLEARCEERSEASLLPFCASINSGMADLLVKLETVSRDIGDWKRGLSLLPPEMILQESDFQSLEKELRNSKMLLRNQKRKLNQEIKNHKQVDICCERMLK